ncbi:preprotein translocase subunit SecE [Rubrivirga sp. SAORIC476]|uniref:preprotein translocase subunit SecE n=1 Tax=Rubrivirga sp. SAORIC476 TaxID=1961794 RepID=UPI000BA9BFF3|nr:preprotein translocase subunit SecE [Rubrivirga sp. SAORIC476]MAQ95810.1 preprotein translocase subunit SecE [Rhodothermaceae bacterium]MBC13612.1 preprotein translocase subunit SecE [Rhodothermaceae bacterium]PAP82513.1 preprotein translocase subunit SecE [Rubrivirga sp. SAORIC476]
MATETQTKVPGGALGNYVVEVRKEMRKVNWPKRKELISNTVLTLASSLAISIFIFGADQVISTALRFIYGS